MLVDPSLPSQQHFLGCHTGLFSRPRTPTKGRKIFFSTFLFGWKIIFDPYFFWVLLKKPAAIGRIFFRSRNKNRSASGGGRVKGETPIDRHRLTKAQQRCGVIPFGCKRLSPGSASSPQATSFAPLTPSEGSGLGRLFIPIQVSGSPHNLPDFITITKYCVL